MPSGKKMPVDLKPKTMVSVTDVDMKDGPRLGQTIQVYQSHFASCPNAEEHRGS